MRYVLSIFAGLALLFFSALPAHAHLMGQPPFFKINNTYSNLYPILSMFPGIELPQDIGPENYLIEKPINFEIDIEKLKKVVPSDIVDRTTFTWEFGDGIQSEGIKQTHTYKKMGSYVLKINAAYTENDQKVGPQLIQSVLLQVLPDEKYQLPRAIIKVNGRQEDKDPLKNVFELNLKDEIVFDASESKAPSSKIVSTLWSFTDGGVSKELLVKHRFITPPEFVNPALRVADANGFFTDAYVGIKNNSKKVNVIYSEQQPKADKHKYVVYTLVFMGGVLLVGFLTRFFIKRS